MKKELLMTLCLAFATQSPLFAQEDAPMWMRWSAISPDGKNIFRPMEISILFLYPEEKHKQSLPIPHMIMHQSGVLTANISHLPVHVKVAWMYISHRWKVDHPND